VGDDSRDVSPINSAATEPEGSDTHLLDALHHDLADMRLTDAIELAKRDADAAQDQLERAGANSRGLLTTLTANGAVTAFLISNVQGRPIHVFAAVTLVIVGVLYLATVTILVWTLRSRLPRRPGRDTTGWLAATTVPVEELRKHYLSRADDMLGTYSKEAAEVSPLAHQRHRGNQRAAEGVRATIIVGAAALFFLHLGW